MRIKCDSRRIVDLADGRSVSLWPGEYEVDEELGRRLVELGVAEELKKEKSHGRTGRRAVSAEDR